MPRRFQFSLRRLFLVVAWLSLASMAAGHAWRSNLSPTPQVLGLLGVMLAGIGGAAGAMTGTPPVRHSLYGALAGVIVHAAIITLAMLGNSR